MASEHYTVITGASRGLGKTFAHAFAKRKKNLVLAARSHSELEGLAKTLEAQHGIKARVCACDLGSEEGLHNLIRAAEPLHVDGLINNAGFGLGGAFAEQDLRRITEMLTLNMVSLTQLTHMFVPQLQQSRGIIINVASQAGFLPMPYFAAYAASKAYVLHFSEALHRELAPQGIKVLALCPGATATEFFNVAGMNLNKTKMKAGNPEKVIETALMALARNQAFVVPGFGNKASAFLCRLMPRSLVSFVGQKIVGH